MNPLAPDTITPDSSAFLRLLPDAIREKVAARFREVRFNFGDLIVKEGDPGDAFFLLVSGRARVLKKGDEGQDVPLNVLKAGDEFGEMALLQGAPRAATIRASSEVVAFRLDAADFKELLGELPQLRDYLELRARHRTLHNFLSEFSDLGRAPLPALRLLLEQLQPSRSSRARPSSARAIRPARCTSSRPARSASRRWWRGSRGTSPSSAPATTSASCRC